MSLRAILTVLAMPGPLLAGLAAGGLVLGVLLWLPNFGLLMSTLFQSDWAPADRLAFAVSAYGSLFVNNSLVGGVVLLLFAALTGVNFALLMYAVSGSFRQAASSGMANLGAVLAASVGAGCAACGSSFLAPLLGGLVGTAGIALARELGVAANVLGVSLLVYSIYRLGITASSLLSLSSRVGR
jgi:hypothetical protein